MSNIDNATDAQHNANSAFHHDRWHWNWRHTWTAISTRPNGPNQRPNGPDTATSGDGECWRDRQSRPFQAGQCLKIWLLWTGVSVSVLFLHYYPFWICINLQIKPDNESEAQIAVLIKWSVNAVDGGSYTCNYFKYYFKWGSVAFVRSTFACSIVSPFSWTRVASHLLASLLYSPDSDRRRLAHLWSHPLAPGQWQPRVSAGPGPLEWILLHYWNNN